MSVIVQNETSKEDSVKVELPVEKSSVAKPVLQLGVDNQVEIQVERPALLQIEEPPPVARRVVAPVVKKIEIYSPSVKDSIKFGLKEYSKHPDGYFFDNSLTRFLNPLERSDRMVVTEGDEVFGKVMTVENRENAIDTLGGASVFISGEQEDSVQGESEKIVKTVAVEEKQDDTVFLISPDSVVVPRDSFEDESRDVFSLKAVPRGKMAFEGNKEWVSGFVLLSVVIVGFVRVSSFKYLRDVFYSAIFFQSARKLFNTVNVRNVKPSFLLNGLFYFNTSLLVFESLTFYNKTLLSQSGFVLFLYIAGVMALLFVGKFLMYRFVGYVFNAIQPTSEYLFNASLLNKTFGVLSTPLIAAIPFVSYHVTPLLMILGAVLFILLYLIQLARGVQIILRDVLSIFYMFLYLCALEILPLSILYKVLIN